MLLIVLIVRCCKYNVLLDSLNCKFAYHSEWGCRLTVTPLWVHSLPVFCVCTPMTENPTIHANLRFQFRYLFTEISVVPSFYLPSMWIGTHLMFLWELITSLPTNKCYQINFCFRHHSVKLNLLIHWSLTVENVFMLGDFTDVFYHCCPILQSIKSNYSMKFDFMLAVDKYFISKPMGICSCHSERSCED